MQGFTNFVKSPLLPTLTILFILVTKGLCDDPLKKKNVYFFGDLFVCEEGMELANETTIQCVYGNSSNDVAWNDTWIPSCKGELFFHIDIIN